MTAVLMVAGSAQANAAANPTSESFRPIESKAGVAQRVPSTKRQRATDCHASAAQPGSQRSQSMLAFVSNIKDLLLPTDLRRLLACSKATTLVNILGYITNDVEQLLNPVMTTMWQRCNAPNPRPPGQRMIRYVLLHDARLALVCGSLPKRKLQS